ncbi:hypothetical protein Q4566_15930 [Tamlana sp. 2_MG-2023]|uniref:DUF6597 domain-containing transcriptional factor n=1 Tax=unclassified Tamlana TaxID=2614803 RepID=UPI0026E428D2|nr:MULTISPECIES: DUF6597 domain-containing transcriptional factor [unclassified Tamlana]MDO6761697.1 hypothetical protein [Tamlana sp. 2_MG-2023]MDO6792251.1 hypothetical protein [Tamlana sp. 1_MG-2023]
MEKKVGVMINIQHYIPQEPLNSFIKHMVYIRGNSSNSYIKELPEGSTNLVIELNENTTNTIYEDSNLKNKKAIKHAWISGMQKQAILYENNPNSVIISIRFTIGGFYQLTGIPISLIKQNGIEAETVLGNSFRDLYQQLLNTKIIFNKFLVLETYFEKYTISQSRENNIVPFVIKNLEKNINWLVHKSGYSQKHIIQVLKKQTGFAPKYLQRIDRFNQLTQAIQIQKGKIDWFFLVEKFGYHDQAHLIKDFSHFSGSKPTDYQKSQILLEENSLVPDMILQPQDLQLII